MTLSDKEYIQVNQALFSLVHAYEARMQKELEHELSLSDCSVLVVMHQFAPLTAAKLSTIMDINPGTISVYIQRLVKKGLVKREQDVDDRRNWWLSFTEIGQTVSDDIVQSAAHYTRDFLSTLDEEGQSMLHHLLLKASHDIGFEWQ